MLQFMNHDLNVSSESVPQNVRMAYLACIGEFCRTHFIFLLMCVCVQAVAKSTAWPRSVFTKYLLFI
jgi:hypothetical protein